MILGPNFDKRLEAFVACAAQLVQLQARQTEALERQAEALERLAESSARSMAMIEPIISKARDRLTS